MNWSPEEFLVLALSYLKKCLVENQCLQLLRCKGQGGACLGRPAKPASGRSSSVVLSLVSQVFSSRVSLLLKGVILMA
ncbi:hypothetical protein E2C01_012680 [Portunus trituberculatus]|uniref:Uncharacterized protein n=1 Tax=Portunus trituberculatus TaxID=210409 RepID=A0A5B7DFD1_PORTR|nr:hypothetical protein [Portunus trituberculatus]